MVEFLSTAYALLTPSVRVPPVGPRLGEGSATVRDRAG